MPLRGAARAAQLVHNRARHPGPHGQELPPAVSRRFGGDGSFFFSLRFGDGKKKKRLRKRSRKPLPPCH